MTHERSVSVVIPVYNGERYLAEAIESALGQSAIPIEVVVVDDGSADNSGGVARAFQPRVRYHLQPNMGAAAARNTGVGLTTGHFIAFLDADDRWLTNKLELQLNAFEQRPDLDMVFCQVDEFVSPDSEMARTGSVQLRKAVPAFYPSGLLVKRQAFDRVGLFATDCGVGEFIDWYARANDASLTNIALPSSLVERRIHDTNQGVTKRDSYNSEYLRILKRALDRRRAKQGS
ncbi:MAG: glycosyltransferase family A protein [Gammaproteobacteria bacterium]